MIYSEKSYDYPLGLFEGQAIGPVKGLASFPMPGSARLLVTEAGKNRGLKALGENDVYYSGGPWFQCGHGVTVLAEYHDGSAAAISQRVVKGEILLIGGHAERPPPPATDEAASPKWAGMVLKALVCPINME